MQAPQLLKQERAALVALLEDLTPDEWNAATLCAGWDINDVAAHLLAREERPFGFVTGKISNGWLGPAPDDLLEQVRSRGQPALIRALRTGPPLAHRLPGPIALMNLVENWVHQEDIRRGELQRLRPTAPATQQTLWLSLPIIARLMLRTVTQAGVVALEQPDGTPLTLQVGAGRPRAAKNAAAAVQVVGEPGELLLFLLGRKHAAQVTLHGDGPLAEALIAARMEI